MRKFVKREAILGMTTTVMIIFGLGLSTMFFSTSISGMVIGPIESMIEKIVNITIPSLSCSE